MADRYPEIEPYEHGMLDAGDGQLVYWEVCGNLDGNPAVGLNGRCPGPDGLARIVTHYFHHHAWLEDGVLLREAGRLDGIPGVLVHGRLDLGGPPMTAWELAQPGRTPSCTSSTPAIPAGRT